MQQICLPISDFFHYCFCAMVLCPGLEVIIGVLMTCRYEESFGTQTENMANPCSNGGLTLTITLTRKAQMPLEH